MKYIMYETADGKRIPFIFPDFLVHAQVADRLGTLLQLSRAKPVSAGSIGTVVVAGISEGSESLALTSDPADATVINCYDYLHGLPNPNAESMSRQILQGAVIALNDAFVGDVGAEYPETDDEARR